MNKEALPVWISVLGRTWLRATDGFCNSSVHSSAENNYGSRFYLVWIFSETGFGKIYFQNYL